MAIEVKCGECGEEFRLKDTAAGKKFTCKVCGAAIQVPAADDFPEDEEDEALESEVPDRPKPRTKKSRRDAVAMRCILPAIFLYICCAMSVVNHVAGAIMASQGANLNPFMPQQPNEPQGVKDAKRIGGVIGGMIGVGIDILVLSGAISLHRRKNHGLAMAGAIVACIPFCSPCVALGIPFGIWALVVLNSADVKDAFQG